MEENIFPHANNIGHFIYCFYIQDLFVLGDGLSFKGREGLFGMHRCNLAHQWSINRCTY